MYELFQKGGFVMYLLIALSIYSLAVMFYKAFQFYRAQVFRTDYIEPAMQLIKSADYPKVEHLLASVQNPVSRVMMVALHCVRNRDMTQQSREAEVTRVGLTEIRYLEQHLRGMEMVSTVGPLIGLLGTVIGMVRAFAKLEASGSRVDPSVLAGGIWEALLTTVGGLAVGVMGLAAYYAVDGIIERTRAAMKDLAVRILTMNDELQAEEIRKKIAESEAKAAQEKEGAARIKAAEKEALVIELKKAREDKSTAPQEQSTLRLLNPRYGL